MRTGILQSGGRQCLRALFAAALSTILTGLQGCVTQQTSSGRLTLDYFDVYSAKFHVDTAVEYLDDLTFSARDEIAGDYPSWPVYIEFMGRKNINQFANRWDKNKTSLIYLDEAMSQKAHGWAEKFYWDVVYFARESLLAYSQHPERRRAADFLVLAADDGDSLEQMRRDALAEYARALEHSGPHERGTYIAPVKDIISVFMPPERDIRDGCFYIGAIDKSHIIRSGVMVIDKNLNWDGWRRCYMRSSMRLFGQLGEVLRHPSVLRHDSNFTIVSLYQMVALEHLYNPQGNWEGPKIRKFEPGAPRTEVLEIMREWFQMREEYKRQLKGR